MTLAETRLSMKHFCRMQLVLMHVLCTQGGYISV